MKMVVGIATRFGVVSVIKFDEWLDCFKVIFMTLFFSSVYNLKSQNSYKLYFGSNMNKIWISSDNLDIINKSTTKPTASPLLGFEFNTKKITLGLELSFFKNNYSNEFKYKDKFQNNVVNTTWKSRYSLITVFLNQQLFRFKSKEIGLFTKFNLAHSSTPFNESALIYSPNSYMLQNQTKANTGFFYSMSVGVKYNVKLNNRFGLFLSSQINSNYNRTLIEENNTIAYPDETMAYQFLKINGKSAGINFGFTYDLKKKNKT